MCVTVYRNIYQYRDINIFMSFESEIIHSSRANLATLAGLGSNLVATGTKIWQSCRQGWFIVNLGGFEISAGLEIFLHAIWQPPSQPLSQDSRCCGSGAGFLGMARAEYSGKSLGV